MEVNIEGFGHTFASRVKLDDPDVPDGLKAQVDQEKVKLENFFQYAEIDISWVQARRRLRRDLETTGNAYLEVIRGANGDIQMLHHIPSYSIRLGRLEEDPQQVEVPIIELQNDKSVKIVKVNTWKRFRRFVQSKAMHLRNLSIIGGYKLRWFKELGDPRVYDNETGLVLTANQIKNWGGSGKPMPIERMANELIHFKIYSSRTPYGLPRYIGNLLSIFGDRASEEINYITFKNNNIPSMAVLVSNGMLTEGSVKRIESFVESQIQGSDNYSKFLILEAEPSGEEGDDIAQMKLTIQPLTDQQHKDQLFQDYSNNNQDKIRRVFRLPPILVGRTENYNKATADASIKLADEQVFAPERDEFDNFINRILFPRMGIVFHKYKSNTPNTTDNQSLVQIISGAENTGGMTPRISRDVMGQILGRDMPAFRGKEVDGFDPDVPFSLAMAQAVKNEADPGEVGQQVTALKRIKKIMGIDYLPDAEAEKALLKFECMACGEHNVVKKKNGQPADTVDELINLQKKLDSRWRAEAKRPIKTKAVDPSLAE